MIKPTLHVTLSLTALLAPTLLVGTDAMSQPQKLGDNGSIPLSATGEDPTRLPTRIGASYDSTVNDHDKSNTDTYLATGSIALFGLQGTAEMPLYKRYNPGSGDTIVGVGDARVGGSFSLPLSQKMRVALGVDTSLNTASKDGLGLDENSYSPFLAIGFQADEHDMAVLHMSYTQAADDDHLKRWDVAIRGIHRWSDTMFTSLEAIPGWNIKDSHFNFGTRGVAGVEIKPKHMFSIEMVQPLDSNSRDANGWDLILNYHFYL